MVTNVAPEVVKQAAEQASLLGTLGVDWRLFLAQLVNFAVVVFVLWRFGYRPLVALLDERKKRIEEGLAHARKAEEDRAHAAQEHDRIVTDAHREAKGILETAAAAAVVQQKETVAATKREAEKVVNDARVLIARERETMRDSLRGELVELVAIATGRVLTEKIDAKKDKELIATAVRSVQ